MLYTFLVTDDPHIFKENNMKHEMNSRHTKQMLVDALITLSNQKPFSKITVSEIVSFCNINRKTFYYHFKDIYDLLEWHLNNEVSLATSSFNSIDSMKDINTTVAYSTNYMFQHSYLKNLIQDPLAREKIMTIMHKTIYPTVYLFLEELEQAQNQTLDLDCKNFLAKNLTRVIILSSFDAIEHPAEYDIEKIQEYLSVIFRISTNGLLQ